jgi:Recombination endonuclease VII
VRELASNTNKHNSQKLIRRRKGVIGLSYVDYSINAETSQPTVQGLPCRNCGSRIKFAKRKGTCVRCHKQWRRDNEKRPQYYYSKVNKNRIKIQPERYYLELEIQEWKCAICGKIPEKKLFVDHCHETGQFRGLLCNKCNSGLGCFADNIDSLYSAIRYLSKC